MRKALVALVIVAAVVFCMKKTHVDSYAGTLWSQVRQGVKDQVPTKFEIDRVRHEIANLEGDIGNMIKPIAEYMAAISRLRKDVTVAETKLVEQKASMLELTKKLEDNPAFVVLDNQKYTAERVRLKLQKDFDSYKRVEAHLKGQNKLLEAKEVALKGAQDQLAKVIAKKREFELRLAQLEADEETLQVARVGCKLQLDDSRATQIEAALSEIENRHDVQRHEIELKTGEFANDNIPAQRTPPAPDLETIRHYLENSAAASTGKN